MNNPYTGVVSTIREYWRAYGGLSALASSPYLHSAIVLTVVLYPVWHDDARATDIIEMSLSVIPTVLGFSLGGYAILLAFGDEEFRLRISGADPDGAPSPFMVTNSAFVHFIVVSTIALLFTIMEKTWTLGAWYRALVCVLFIYSILCALASAFAVFLVAGWYDAQAGRRQKSDRNGK